MSKRVTIFCQLFYPELISSGQTVTELAEALQEKGLDITVYCAQPTLQSQASVPRTLTHKSILVKRLWATRFPKLNLLGKLINHLSFGLSCIFKLLCMPRESRVLVFTNPPFLPWIVAIVQPLKGLHVTTTVFDMYPETLVAENFIRKGGCVQRLFDWFNMLCYKRSTHIIAIGSCMQRILDQKMAALSKNSTYIPIWADSKLLQDKTAKKTRNFRHDWGIAEDAFIVGYSGNMARFHPIETMLEAARYLQDLVPIYFVFLGDGAKRQWALDYAKDHTLSNCQFHPYVDRKDLAALLSSFDCGLVGLNEANTGLSVPSKTMGLLSAGVPVIACCSADCEIAALIQEFQCGTVSDPTDSNGLAANIRELYEHPKTTALYKSNTQTAVEERFNLNHSASKFFSILQQ